LGEGPGVRAFLIAPFPTNCYTLDRQPAHRSAHFGEFDPKELVANHVEEIAAMVQEEKALLEIMRKHCKK
jgi:hypothetical protein